MVLSSFLTPPDPQVQHTRKQDLDEPYLQGDHDDPSEGR